MIYYDDIHILKANKGEGWKNHLNSDHGYFLRYIENNDLYLIRCQECRNRDIEKYTVEAVNGIGFKNIRVVCMDCGCVGAVEESVGEAIDAWNQSMRCFIVEYIDVEKTETLYEDF